MESTTREQFPWSIVLLSNALAVSIYAIGVYVMAGIGLWLVIAYVLYCLWIEFRVLKRSCVNCYYYGKWCGLGKGKLCSLLFKRGDTGEFANDEVSWFNILPDFLVSVFPLVCGIVLLALGWSWLLAVLLAALVVLSSVGNAVVRGSFVCKYCKQRELGCPAEKLFSGAREQRKGT